MLAKGKVHARRKEDACSLVMRASHGFSLRRATKLSKNENQSCKIEVKVNTCSNPPKSKRAIPEKPSIS